MTKTYPSKLATYRLDYTGPVLSLNDYKSKDRWEIRTLYKEVQKRFAAQVLQSRPPRWEWFELTIFHNTRLDMDNVAGTVKPCIDVLAMDWPKYCKLLKPRFKVWAGPYIDDDNRKNWTKLSIIYFPGIPKGTLRFEFYGELKDKNNGTKQ